MSFFVPKSEYMELHFEQRARFHRRQTEEQVARTIMIEILMEDEALWMLEGIAYDQDYTMIDNERLQELVDPDEDFDDEESRPDTL